MTSTYFLDTNILVYAFEPDPREKMVIARKLISDAEPWQISWQLVQEFCSVALHRFKKPLHHSYLASLIELLLSPHCSILQDAALWQSAIRIQTETQYRFYDSLIVAAALRSGASELYSVDLQHGRRFVDLEIRNPFHV